MACIAVHLIHGTVHRCSPLPLPLLLLPLLLLLLLYPP
jgi:hypothetical protein